MHDLGGRLGEKRQIALVDRRGQTFEILLVEPFEAVVLRVGRRARRKRTDQQCGGHHGQSPSGITAGLYAQDPGSHFDYTVTGRPRARKFRHKTTGS